MCSQSGSIADKTTHYIYIFCLILFTLKGHWLREGEGKKKKKKKKKRLWPDPVLLPLLTFLA